MQIILDLEKFFAALNMMSMFLKFSIIPKKVKLTYARGRPLGLPHIEHPTDADVEKYHALYVKKLVELFDRYKKFNPDYADKQLAVE